MENIQELSCGTEYDYIYFKDEILKLTGIRLHDYKEKQMKRRINTLITRKHFADYAAYLRALQENTEELEYFVNYVTIHVTEFFRTREHWACFEEIALPALIPQGADRLTIWSCACSTGEEPYSVVMSLADMLPLDQIHVLATDLNRKVLAQAQAGIFSDKSMESMPDDRKQRYFLHTDRGWCISEAIRNCVSFRQLDLLQDEFPSQPDLILCRNVLIYFTEDAKNEIYQKFYDTLPDGGYLFTGNTEQIIQYKQFGFTRIKPFLYKK